MSSWFFSGFTLNPHVYSLICFSFCYLKNIVKISIVSHHELEMVIRAFLSSLNALYTHLSKTSLKWLQAVQNCLARFPSNFSKFLQVTPIVIQQHWLRFILESKLKIIFTDLKNSSCTYTRESGGFCIHTSWQIPRVL